MSYDDLFRKLAIEATHAEISGIKPEDFLSEIFFRELKSRIAAIEPNDNPFEDAPRLSLDQHLQCDIRKVEANGNAFMKEFMNKTRASYGNYNKEAAALINTFSNTTEMFVFLFQLMQGIRYKKQQKINNTILWDENLNGI